MVSYRGRSSLWWLAVVGLFVLLAILVVVVVAVNKRFAARFVALAGRIAVLEAGWSYLVIAGPPPAAVVSIYVKNSSYSLVTTSA